MNPFSDNSVVKAHRTLSENCRLIEFVVDESSTFILLEVGGEDNWSSVLAYEICKDNTVKRHEFNNKKEQSTKDLKISPKAVSNFREVLSNLLLNDLLNHWEKYCENFIGGEDQLVFEPTMIIEKAYEESKKFIQPESPKKSQSGLDRFLLKYQMGKVVDENEYFVLHEAQRKKNKKAVVVKTIKVDLDDRKLALAKHILEREATLLNTLKNPGIITLEESHFDSDSACLVIEPYGETLEDRLEWKVPIDESDVVWIGQQICIILKYLHQLKKPILYLNLSPKSISFKNDILMLHDFSKATFVRPRKDKDREAYAPPEAYLTELEQRSDLYSLGRVLVRLSMARKDGMNKPSGEPETLARQIYKQIKAAEYAEDAFIDPKKIDSGNAELDEFLKKLTSPIPNFRPQNVDEVLNELNQLAKNQDHPLDFSP